MVKIKRFQTLEEELLLLQQEAKHAPLSIARILRILSGKGRFLILILLSIPFCQPIQIPGLSTPFGLIIAFIGLRIAFGRRIWLPKSLLVKKISSSTFDTIMDKTLILVRKIRSWIHPRLIWLCHSSALEKINGLIIFILGVFLALPLPIPFSNLAAAWSIFLISLGMLEDDGILVLIGYVVFVLAAIFFLFLGLTAKEFFW